MQHLITVPHMLNGFSFARPHVDPQIVCNVQCYISEPMQTPEHVPAGPQPSVRDDQAESFGFLLMAVFCAGT
jgi:hypothetical protein